MGLLREKMPPESQIKNNQESINVAIVGGGPGCKAIMDMIIGDRLSQLRMKLVGVACTNPEAVGYRYAQDMNIFTTEDFRDLYELRNLQMIIELTGKDDVAEELLRTRPKGLRVMDHVVASLFWDIFQIEEERLQQRRQAEKVLRQGQDELERRIEEATCECSHANVLLREENAERKLAEDALRKKNEELESFAHAISHDLKAPIISVQGFSSLLLRHHVDQLDEKGMRYVEQIQASGRRMETLIADLLSLVKTGKLTSRFQDVSSLNIVKGLEASLQPRLEEKGITLSISDDLPMIRCDEKRMGQVLENLLVNAIKFMGNVQNPRIDVGYEDKGGAHQFYVRDNGIGIDPSCHKKVFHVFRQLKEIEDQEGTGIGLAIVAKIIEGHGGKIWVASEKGQGATFYFSLPKDPEPCVRRQEQ
jgi:signal transduction histidine kinase